MTTAKTILFLCTGNSCRSQMAEAWCRHIWQNQYSQYSAGIEKSVVNPFAAAVLAERGVSVAGQFSKLITELPSVSFDVVFTLCRDVHEKCPIFGGARVVHHAFDDPFVLAKGSNEAESLKIYNRTCDAIEAFVRNLNEFI